MALGIHNRISGRRFVTLEGPPSWRHRRALDRNPTAVHVIEADPELKDLECLLPWADRIKYLIITDFNVRDIGALAKFKNLIELDLWMSHRPKQSWVPLDAWPHLRALAMAGSTPVSLTAGHGLQELLIESPTSQQLDALPGLPDLGDLRLSRVIKLPDQLTGGELHSLDLASMSWNAKYPAMQSIDGLRHLILTGVKGLIDLAPFAAAQSLDELVVEDCQDLTSIAGPGLSANAKILLIGRTPARRKQNSNPF